MPHRRKRVRCQGQTIHALSFTVLCARPKVCVTADDDPFDLLVADLMRRLGGENETSVVDITDESNLKFRCSLMTLTLPVSIVALKILES